VIRRRRAAKSQFPNLVVVSQALSGYSDDENTIIRWMFGCSLLVTILSKERVVLVRSARPRNSVQSLVRGFMSSIKRDVKKKVLPRPEARCFLEIQPTGMRLR
jgi:hypothetical protein